MKMTVKAFAALCDVSVRTLHYYDEIGLLSPSAVDTHNGYRYYDEQALERMQAILFYRELHFPLKQIAAMLSSPQYDRQTMLSEQKHLLLLEKQRLERVIAAIEQLEKGETIMYQEPKDHETFQQVAQQYRQEAEQRWGQTDAYREFAQKTKGHSDEQQQAAIEGMEALTEDFAAYCREGIAPSDPAVQALVTRWQDYITEHYYTCTDTILAGLGEMYAADERFRRNLDRHGKGTADYLRAAIRCYVQSTP